MRHRRVPYRRIEHIHTCVISVLKGLLISTTSTTPGAMLVTVENKHAKHTCSQRAPKVVVVIIGLHWIAFLYGVLFQLSVAELSSPIFISPSNSELWFRGTGVSTLRMHPVVTILTHQACHAGYSHIINNHILLIATGGFVELALGPVSVLTIYAAGITGGAIFHSFVWQSNPLIGCSHGSNTSLTFK